MPASEVEPQRNILRVVQSLHLRGYQRLRISPGMSPSGMHWRCTITPVTNILRSHGAMLDDFDHLTAHYSTGSGRNYFDWTDAQHASAGQLAALFITRFPELAAAGRGSDWAYAGWYLEMLHLTYPSALPIAYADWETPTDCLSTVNGDDSVRIPLPPPGASERIRA